MNDTKTSPHSICTSEIKNVCSRYHQEALSLRTTRKTVMANITAFLVVLLLQLTCSLAWIVPATKALSWIAPATTSRAKFIIPSNQRKMCILFSGADMEEDEEDDEPPSVDISSFVPPQMSYGLNKGRSSPSQRKAMGRSGSSTARIHICTNCGSEFVKWMGRCPTCKEWNTMQEHVVTRQEQSLSQPLFGSSNTPRQPSWLDGIDLGDNGLLGSAPIRMSDLTKTEVNNDKHNNKRRGRILVPDDEEFNMVLGGGIMRGSLTLIGGEPGVGKSTLLLQIASSLASLATPLPGIGMGLSQEHKENDYGPVWYVSGEENPDQIASRAERLGIHESELWLLSETHADSLCERVARQLRPSLVANNEEEQLGPKPPSLLIVDSIQTVVCNAGGSSAAGGITQVRECASLFLRLAKSTGIPVFLVGHVTKSGDVAGPRTVEHMVDAVLYLEGSDMGGSGNVNIRMLRASKNRFGSADEVGVYEMTTRRLLPVSDPSSLFLAHRQTEDDLEGSAIAIALEGRRAMTVEVQALASYSDNKSAPGRRTVDGIAYSRLALLLGVLQKRCRMFFSRQDIYVNVVGRMRLDRGEGNSADLAIAVALVSSLSSIAVRSDTAFVGEVGLLGELRFVPSIEKRLQEARRMGFSRVITPIDYGKQKGKGRVAKGVHTSMFNGIEWIQCSSLSDAINAGLVNPVPPPRRRKSQTKTKEARNDVEFPASLEDLNLEEIMDDDDEAYFL